MTLQAPPLRNNLNGKPRCVGVEVEFAGLAARDTAALVARLFDGEITTVSPHRLLVTDTRWGTFGIELDTQYAHPDPGLLDNVEASGTPPKRRLELHAKTRELIGDMVTGLVPTEIICPPVPWDELERLDALFEALHTHGAKGTDASLLYGFGLHLNVEIADQSVTYLLAMLRAYLLLAPWLRKEINVDITREVLPHANPFAKEYALKVLDARYAPDLDTLIDDYLRFNPTRNRELDLLPLFRYLSPSHPNALLHDGLTKPRPTFHYRLPNAQLSHPNWGALMEWNRWVEVEKLAFDDDALKARCADFVAEHTKPWWQRLKARLSRRARV
ncbi:amidoligase family protein [Halomonas dongshanensis]|uniref:Amidoligase family protein n=1 Tax=Halomonas dongshanensis TaxID=2890835 RepID=A0ABT2EDM8_9GAMM|nr:amidoligase family protein [Halomonas dongshanensis]MCS2609594.1 amidoligase family protein [Halomonas dongshanensis]